MHPSLAEEVEVESMDDSEVEDFLDFMEERAAPGETIRDRQILKLLALARSARQDQVRWLWLRAALRPQQKLVLHARSGRHPAYMTLVAGTGRGCGALEEIVDAELETLRRERLL